MHRLEKLQAFEIKWSSRKVVGRAFQNAYGVEVRGIRLNHPFTEHFIHR